jgi:hypothetical protein
MSSFCLAAKALRSFRGFLNGEGAGGFDDIFKSTTVLKRLKNSNHVKQLWYGRCYELCSPKQSPRQTLLQLIWLWKSKVSGRVCCGEQMNFDVNGSAVQQTL